MKVPAFQGNVDAPPSGDGGDAVDMMIDAPGVPNACGVADQRLSRMGSLICGPNYTMHLSNSGAHYPTSWMINGHEVLSPGDNGNCDEHGTGVSLYPAEIIDNTGTEPQIQAIYDGPAVIKLQTTWDRNLACSMNAHVVGKTIWSFFPDGRITRYDYIHRLNDLQTMSCPCGDGLWIVTSYFTFLNDQLSFGGLPSIPTTEDNANPIMNQEGGGELYLCGHGPQWELAMGWAADGDGARVRTTDTSATPGAVAVVKDMYHSMGDAIDGTDPDDWGAEWHILVGPPGGGLGCPHERIAQMTQHTQLEMQFATDAETREPVQIGHDGIYGGEYDHDMLMPLEVPANLSEGRINAQSFGGLPAGMTVDMHWLAGDTTSTFTVVKQHVNPPGPSNTLVAGKDYILQTEPGASQGVRVQIWFKDALVQYDQLRITKQ